MARPDGGFIVVGFDGTAQGSAALRWAMGRAAGTRTAVKVVHHWSPATTELRKGPGGRGLRGGRAATVRAVEKEALAARMATPNPPEISLVFSSAPVAALLANQTRGAAMLVLGASSASVLADPTCGPVAGPCLDRTGCPVVVVDRRGRAVTTPPRHPALGLAG